MAFEGLLCAEIAELHDALLQAPRIGHFLRFGSMASAEVSRVDDEGVLCVRSAGAATAQAQDREHDQQEPDRREEQHEEEDRDSVGLFSPILRRAIVHISSVSRRSWAHTRDDRSRDGPVVVEVCRIEPAPSNTFTQVDTSDSGWSKRAEPMRRREACVVLPARVRHDTRRRHSEVARDRGRMARQASTATTRVRE